METAIVPSPAPLAPTPKIVKRAIVYAILFDMGVSMAFGAVLVYIYMAVISGWSFIYFSDLQKEIAANPYFIGIIAFFGSVVSVMSGYLAAQVGKARPYAHALWASSILVFIAAIGLFVKFTLALTRTTEVTTMDMFGFFWLPSNIIIYLIGAHLYRCVNAPKHGSAQ